MAWFGVGVAVWMLAGVVIAVWQRRRGHHLLTWVVLGLVFGPLTLVLAIDAERGLAEMGRDPLAGDDLTHLGPVDVVIGVDGSDRSRDAARSAIAMLGDRAGRITLVQALDPETAIDPALGRDRIEARLAAERDELHLADVRTTVAVGRPADAIRDFAIDHHYDLIVVGAKGAGMTERLLGSVTQTLLAGCPIPVLVGGAVSSDAGPAEAATDGSSLDRPCRSPIVSGPTSD